MNSIRIAIQGRHMKRSLRVGAIVCLSAAVGVVAFAGRARADDPATFQIAIPKNVTVTVGQTRVVFIGKPTSTSTVTCAPGTPQPQTVVATHPGGGHASQVTGVLAFHDHKVPNGTRYAITAGPNGCNGDLDLYTAQLD